MKFFFILLHKKPFFASLTVDLAICTQTLPFFAASVSCHYWHYFGSRFCFIFPSLSSSSSNAKNLILFSCALPVNKWNFYEFFSESEFKISQVREIFNGVIQYKLYSAFIFSTIYSEEDEKCFLLVLMDFFGGFILKLLLDLNSFDDLK